ncbi:polysaccharide deacetylase family protein [Defluviitalea phaphyphila]|uniref:polysaccharide deacetylase family protein n=1 Tax=Defluviitalea phaphyphila TaxID=1473580 RepID=UPI0007304FF8|nr:polysaccharide deacetylase family protein [Defluviitalea phaphyphila]
MKEFKVLMYHEVINREMFNYDKYKGIKVQQNYRDILPLVLFHYLDSFKEQMQFLYNEGYVTLSLKDIIDFYYGNKELPEKAVLLTFDDMYKSVLINVYPILKHYNFHAVGFIVRDWVFNEPQKNFKDYSVCLSFKELDKMRDIFEYANHTKALHTRGNSKMALQNIDKEVFIKDIKECEKVVTTKKVFAYPFGVYTEENIKWLKEIGFLLAFTTEKGKNTRLTNPYKLHRNGIFLDYDLEKFKTILNN